MSKCLQMQHTLSNEFIFCKSATAAFSLFSLSASRARRSAASDSRVSRRRASVAHDHSSAFAHSSGQSLQTPTFLQYSAAALICSGVYIIGFSFGISVILSRLSERRKLDNILFLHKLDYRNLYSAIFLRQWVASARVPQAQRRRLERF